jgi:hypothetical protein
MLRPQTAGKVWEFVEMASFIGAGTTLLSYWKGPSVKKTEAVYVNTMSFLAGKGAYFVTKGLSHLAGQSSETGRLYQNAFKTLH